MKTQVFVCSVFCKTPWKKQNTPPSLQAKASKVFEVTPNILVWPFACSGGGWVVLAGKLYKRKKRLPGAELKIYFCGQTKNRKRRRKNYENKCT